MTPEPQPAPPAPRRTPRRLAPAVLVLLALSGWVACLALIGRDAARTRIRPRPGAAVVFRVAYVPPVLLASARASDPGEFEAFRTTQAALVRGRFTLLTALKRPEVAQLGVVREQPDPVEWLAEGLRVSFDAPELMRVELDGNPEEAVVILDAVAQAYLAEVDKREHGARRERLQKLTDSNREYRAEVERHSKRIDTIAVVLGSKDGPTLALMDSLFKDELRAAWRERAEAAAALELYEAEAAPDPERVAALKRRVALARARAEDVQKQTAKMGDYRIELETLKAARAQAQKLGGRVAEEAERVKLELGAPPRVTLAAEPYARTAR